jgi:hypothetical protein
VKETAAMSTKSVASSGRAQQPRRPRLADRTIPDRTIMSWYTVDQLVDMAERRTLDAADAAILPDLLGPLLAPVWQRERGDDVNEYHQALALDAQEALLRAEHVAELAGLLTVTEDEDDGCPERRLRVSTAIVFLYEEAPKLKDVAAKVAKALAGPDTVVIDVAPAGA